MRTGGNPVVYKPVVRKSVWRRRLLIMAVSLFMVSNLKAAEPLFGFEQLATTASELAAKPYQAPEQIPGFLIDLKYDEFREIRFRPEQALWQGSGLNYHAEFIHPGLFYNHSVKINIVDSNSIQPLVFHREDFTYPSQEFADKVPPDLGFAGFRLNYPIKTLETYNQVIVFAGASYFRAVGKNQVFGLSGRGLAVDTALPSGEEFPYFSEFWLEKPDPESTEMTVYALLDSKRVTGAYQYTIKPGETTAVDVKSRLFMRDNIELLGVAPLTSMYLYGEERARPSTDWRNEIHDSDGLLIETAGGERIWRPLVNPQRLLVSQFALENPKGFGLIQRDRDFSSYEDLEAKHEQRPSAWVTPTNEWGKGGVRLVEIPTPDETNDNIVAFWVPESVPAIGQPINFNYQIDWQEKEQRAPGLGYTSASRMARNDQKDKIQFVVDFAGEELARLPAETIVDAVVTVGEGGELRHQSIEKNPVTQGWRLAFSIKIPASATLELRAVLKMGDKTLTETWSYLLEL